MADEEGKDVGTDAGAGKQAAVPKGPPPPRFSLSEAVAIIVELYERAGGSASLDELSQILGNSRKSSSFVIKINALKKLDLIYSDDEKVHLSSTANCIVAPTEASERSEALKSTFLRNDVFKAVYEKYIGKILPQDEFLRNTLVEQTARDVADKWMEQFKESATFAGLLMDRGDGKFQVREIAKAESSSPPSRGNEIPRQEERPAPQVQTPMDHISQLAVEPPKTNFQFLIEILNADMNAEEQNAVWTLIQYLKKKEAGVLSQPQAVLPKKQTPDADTSGES